MIFGANIWTLSVLFQYYRKSYWSDIMIEYLHAWIAIKADRRAVTALEYGLIAGVIVATIAVGFSMLATQLSNQFVGIGSSL
jgi:Flp pilus assembly pilin Flp